VQQAWARGCWGSRPSLATYCVPVAGGCGCLMSPASSSSVGVLFSFYCTPLLSLAILAALPFLQTPTEGLLCKGQCSWGSGDRRGATVPAQLPSSACPCAGLLRQRKAMVTCSMAQISGSWGVSGRMMWLCCILWALSPSHRLSLLVAHDAIGAGWSQPAVYVSARLYGEEQ